MERNVTLLLVSPIEVWAYPFLEPLLDPTQAPAVFRPLIVAKHGQAVLYTFDRALAIETLRSMPAEP